MKNINNVVLLCSEITKGMKSYGPKSFVPVCKNKIPFIIYQIQQILNTHGKNTAIYIVIGFEQEKISKLIESKFPSKKYKNISLIYNSKYQNTNKAYALSLAISKIKQGNTLIFNNGIWSNFKPENKKIPILPVVNTSKDMFDIGITIENHRASYLCYGLNKKWSEIIYLDTNTIS
jgi:NDP-sugar pyrophosphorylase family protein